MNDPHRSCDVLNEYAEVRTLRRRSEPRGPGPGPAAPEIVPSKSSEEGLDGDRRRREGRRSTRTGIRTAAAAPFVASRVGSDQADRAGCGSAPFDDRRIETLQDDGPRVIGDQSEGAIDETGVARAIRGRFDLDHQRNPAVDRAQKGREGGNAIGASHKARLARSDAAQSASRPDAAVRRSSLSSWKTMGTSSARAEYRIRWHSRTRSQRSRPRVNSRSVPSHHRHGARDERSDQP